MRIVIDTERCQGHALCYQHAPQLVKLDDLGYAGPASDVHLDEQGRLLAEKIVATCAERAISLAEN
jgi:ferredoxin